MPHHPSPANCPPLIGRLHRSPESQPQGVIKLPSASIHDLDDDSLLYVFNLLRPSLLEEHETGTFWKWRGQRWWYKPVQVCRRWRRLILGSASYLRLCLVCTPGTPVADMLTHSPPFPLVLGYNCRSHELTAEDEEGIMLALRHRDRVRFIYLHVTVPTLKKLLPAVDDEFPVLEYLYIGPPVRVKNDTQFTLPPTFQAPHLRDFSLRHFASPIGSPLLSTAIGLVGLWLDWIHPSTYPHPNDFLQLLSLLPHLEEISISFHSSVPNRDIERQILHTPITTHIIHLNLRCFDFVGVSGFLEAILPRMAAPLLETLRLQFFNQLHFSVLYVPHFIMTTEKFGFDCVVFGFHHEAVILLAYTVGAKLSDFHVTVSGRHLDWQVSSAAQISNDLRPLFSDVVDLTLDYREHTFSSEWHNQADHMQWRELLGSFRNVKTLRVHDGLVGEVSRSLKLGGEPPLEILPELKELICPTRSVNDKTFAPFIWEREDAGQPVSLVGEMFPVGRTRYVLHTSTGNTYIKPD